MLPVLLLLLTEHEPLLKEGHQIVDRQRRGRIHCRPSHHIRTSWRLCSHRRIHGRGHKFLHHRVMLIVGRALLLVLHAVGEHVAQTLLVAGLVLLLRCTIELRDLESCRRLSCRRAKSVRAVLGEIK